MIIELHSRGRARGLQDLVSDAIYLFQNQDFVHQHSLEEIRLADESEFAYPGYKLYLDRPGKSFAISQYANQEGSGVALVHPQYITAARDLGRESEFVEWLVEHVHVSIFPLLVRDTRLTKEFEFFTTKAMDDLLLLFRDNWRHYSSQIHESVCLALFTPWTTVKHEVSKIVVKCTDGVPRPLRETILPLPHLKALGSYLPFLDIPLPTDPRWLKFETLGVITEENLDLYLRQLKAMAVAEHSHQVEDIREIYRNLAARSTSDVSSIR